MSAVISEKVTLTVVARKGTLTEINEEWLNAKTDGIECTVSRAMQSQNLYICINDESWIIDVEEIANTLINKVILEVVSNCCKAPIEINTGVCSKCKEHCEEEVLG